MVEVDLSERQRRQLEALHHGRYVGFSTGEASLNALQRRGLADANVGVDKSFRAFWVLTPEGAALAEKLFGPSKRPPPAPSKREAEKPLASYDDGGKVYLDSYAGGAASEGAWGTLTLRFVAADGTETRRLYRAEAETSPSLVRS